MERKRVFVIDGYGQIFRSYFAFLTNPLKDKDGNNVSAVYGFFNTIMMIIRQYKPDYLVVALDSKGKTFRHELYPLYKANRDKTPDDLHTQIPVITRILDSMHIVHFAQQGMEADDIIASIAKSAETAGLETVMFTGDKDLLQLVRENVSALRPPKKGEKEYRLCHEAEVQEIFGVRPDQIIDYLTILGDSSDNVPGINGIGEKGAVKLLSDYNHISDIYENIDKQSNGIKTKLKAAEDHINLSKTLIELKDDLFHLTKEDFERYSVSLIDWNSGIREFEGLGSESLSKAAKRIAGNSYSAVEEKKEPIQPVLADYNSELILDDPMALIGFNLKEKVRELKQDGKQVRVEFDCEIAAWMLASDSGRYSFEEICEKYLGSSEFSYEDGVRRLYPVLKSELEKNELYDAFVKIEMPLIPVLADMENKGIILDTTRLKQFCEDLENECSETEESIYTVTGHLFNINSPKQLQEVLFEERKLPVIKKTKSGYSTDSDVLQELADTVEDPIPSLILRYRTLSKLLSTYVNSLPQMINPQTGRIHTSFLQTGTATGRLSSKNPNLQNIPIRTEEGRRIRDAFVPAEGYKLMSADYSQVELVVLAHLSHDRELCRAFEQGDDIHKTTAALVFGIFPDMVTSQQRRMAKTINFGIMYGMGAFSLAKDLKISRREAQQFIDSYFERFSGVKEFIDTIKQNAKVNGFVRTENGHIRYIPEMMMSNKAVLAGAERVAVNSVIQGTAAEIMKLAMVEIQKCIEREKMGSRILLQVHDEVILEVPENEIEKAEELLRKAMTQVCKLSVPLRVSIETGSSWGEMH